MNKTVSRQLWLIAGERVSKITQPPPNIHTHCWLSFYAANMKDMREERNKEQ